MKDVNEPLSHQDVLEERILCSRTCHCSSIIQAGRVSDGNPNKYCCEIRLEVPGNDLFVKKNSDSFEKAVVSATDALRRSTRRAKEKLVDRHQSGLTEKI